MADDKPADKAADGAGSLVKGLGAVTALLLAVAGLVTALKQAGLIGAAPAAAASAPAATASSPATQPAPMPATVQATGNGAVAVGSMSGGSIQTQVGPAAASAAAGGGSR